MAATIVKLAEKDPAIKRMQHLLSRQQQAYRHMPLPTSKQRVENLRRLKAVILKYQDQCAEAINKDFGCRSKNETLIAELLTSVQSINYAIKNTSKWMRPDRRKISMLFAPAKNQVLFQPLGVVGIIAPWNYPVLMVTGPLVTALAAGNRAMIKVSEFTPHVNAVIKQALAEAFDESHVAIIEGGADTAAAFSDMPFNHLLFTGSTSVGRQVMAAAAKNLTPVTLELGGKSPVIVSSHISLDEAAKRICYGKSLNAGQTCIAPDYIMVPRGKEQAFIDAYDKAFSNMYPSLKNNADYTAIINDRHYQRLSSWVADAKAKGATITELNPGNEDLSNTHKMAPVIISKTNQEMTVMQEELFGPILPVISYRSMDDALQYINDRPRPLALYYFGYNQTECDHVLNNSHAGGVSINDTLKHMAQDDMAFGGVGHSGIGHYHGKEGFLALSHSKSVHKVGRFSSGKLVYPPYNSRIIKMLKYVFLR